MLRIFIILFISISLIWTVTLDIYYPETSITPGIVIPSTERAYSYYHKEIDCGRLDNWKTEFGKLTAIDAPVPKLLKIWESSPSKRECDVFFQNIFDIDHKIYKNAYILIDSFKKLLINLESVNNYKPFGISVNSFAYQPLTRSFVFVDIDKLEPIESSENSEEKKLAFRKEVATSFLNSLKAEGIYLTLSDLKKLEEFDIDLKIFPEHLIFKEKHIKVDIDENTDIQKTTSSTSSFNLLIKKNENFYDFSVKKQKTEIFRLNSISVKDTFTVYLCTKAFNYEDIKCKNLNVEDIGTILSDNYSLRDYERIDIEVQETFAQNNRWNGMEFRKI